MGRIVFLFVILLLFMPVLAHASGNDPPPLEINVRIFLDALLYDAPETESELLQEIEDILRFVNAVFGREFGITLKISDVMLWKFSPDSHELPASFLTHEAERLDNGKNDLVLMFTGRRIALCKSDDAGTSDEEWDELTSFCTPGERKEISMGSAVQNGTNAVIVLSPESQYIALHEIGHLFGAEHTQEFSVMRSPLSSLTEHFDEKNKERILKSRQRFLK